MSVEKKGRSISFVLGIVLASAFVFGLEKRVQFNYLNPSHLIPLRHVVLSPDLIVKQQIFQHTKTNVKIVVPQVLFETRFRKGFELSEIVGMKAFLGTYGKTIEINKIDALLSTKEFIYHCVSSQRMTVKDNQWFEAKLHCDSRKSPPTVSAEATLEFQSDEHAPLAIYQGDCDQSMGRICQDLDFPAVDFIKSIFPQDIPNASFETAMNYGGLWNFGWLSTLRMSIRLLILVSFGFFTMLVVGFFRTYPSIDLPKKMPLFVLASMMLWTGLLMHQILQNPPFHDPDEPKHVRGLLQDALTAEEIQQSEEILFQNAAATHYSQTTKTLIIPIIHEAPPSQGFGIEDGSVSPQSRSLFYPIIARPLVRAAYKLFEAHSSRITKDLGFYLKVSFTFPIILFCFFIVWINIILQRYASIGLFLAAILTPSLIPLTPIISNYGFTIMAGACTVSFIYPEGKYISRLIGVIAAICCIFLTASLATSQGFFLLLGITATFVAVFYTIQEREFCSFSQKALLIFVTFTGIAGTWYFCDGFFGPSWIGGRASFEDMVIKLMSKVGLTETLFKSHSPFRSLVIQCLALLSLGFLGLSYVFRQSSKTLPDHRWIRSRTPFLLKNKHSTKIRLLATGSFFLVLGVLAYQVTNHYPSPVYIQNLYGAGVTRPMFSSFLREATRALTSQSFEIVQDYYLFQSFILAYCLDTTAPPVFYFVVRQLVHLGCIGIVLSLIWRSRKSFILIFPNVLSYIVYLVLLFYAAYRQSHTLVGRYTFPGWGLGIFAFILAFAFLISKKEERDIPAILIVSTAFIFVSVLTTLYGQSLLLPMRFVVGGNWY